jgi:hypothetical protein
MDLLMILKYYVLIDVTVSLVLFGVLYHKRHVLIGRFKTFIMNVVEEDRADLSDRIDVLEAQIEDMEETEPKPTMKQALNEVFKLIVK